MAKRKQKKSDFKSMAIDPHAAAREGKTAALRAFVDAGGDINTRGRGQLLRTPLHIAIESRKVAVARMLIELGADVNAEDFRKVRPLHYAARMGLIVLVELLLERGAEPNALDTFGETAMFDIAKGGGRAPVRDHVAVVRRLIAAGVEADAVGNAGRTPLWSAAYRGDVSVAKALLDAGADPNKRAWGELGTPKDAASGERGGTPKNPPAGNRVAKLLAERDSTTEG